MRLRAGRSARGRTRPNRSSEPGSPCLRAAIATNRGLLRRHRRHRPCPSSESNSCGYLRLVACYGINSVQHRNPEGKTAPDDIRAIVDVLRAHPAAVRLDDGAAQVEADAHAFGLGGEE